MDDRTLSYIGALRTEHNVVSQDRKYRVSCIAFNVSNWCKSKQYSHRSEKHLTETRSAVAIHLRYLASFRLHFNTPLKHDNKPPTHTFHVEPFLTYSIRREIAFSLSSHDSLAIAGQWILVAIIER